MSMLLIYHIHKIAPPPSLGAHWLEPDYIGCTPRVHCTTLGTPEKKSLWEEGRVLYSFLNLNNYALKIRKSIPFRDFLKAFKA